MKMMTAMKFQMVRKMSMTVATQELFWRIHVCSVNSTEILSVDTHLRGMHRLIIIEPIIIKPKMNQVV